MSQGNRFRFALPIALPVLRSSCAAAAEGGPGIFPRIVTGRKKLALKAFAHRERRSKAPRVATSPFSPSLYGEKVPQADEGQRRLRQLAGRALAFV
ncbi:exported hypothetical protein [Mesorhizobium sp. STM 4661]|nr:exported hypothetical protein [Mesorhizobium sp. STM 4661]